MAVERSLLKRTFFDDRDRLVIMQWPNVPLIGFHLADAVRAGAIRLAGDVARFTPDGVRFVDGTEAPFDQVILATGYSAAVAMFGAGVRLDACGFAARRSRVISADQPGLYIVGHNYSIAGALRNIARDATRVARLIAGDRRQDDRPHGADGRTHAQGPSRASALASSDAARGHMRIRVADVDGPQR